MRMPSGTYSNTIAFVFRRAREPFIGATIIPRCYGGGRLKRDIQNPSSGFVIRAWSTRGGAVEEVTCARWWELRLLKVANNSFVGDWALTVNDRTRMIHIFINAFSASAGGGLTYVRNVVPRLATREGVRTTLLVGGTLREEISESLQVKVLSESGLNGSAGRFWYEQRNLPRTIRRAGADILLSTGNFALYRSPVPQILLSRNALYTVDGFCS